MSDSPSPVEQLFAEREEADPQPARKKRRRGLRNTLISLGVLVVLLAAVAGIGYAMVSSKYNEIERIAVEQDPSWTRPAASEGDAINILLLGSDDREATDRTLSAEEITGFRSDAIMVAQISPDRQHVTVMSIMRDNWVNIEGHGEAKINAAMSYGGLPLAINTIENFIGARIDHVAMVDFQSFQGLTDAVGGVPVHNALEFDARGHHFDAGDITLDDGEEALAYVRERYSFSDGDYQRARNQQAYMQGLLGKMLSKETLTDVPSMMDSFDALKPYLILDEDLDLSAAVNLGLEMKDIRADGIDFFTSPTNGTGTSADGQSIVLPNEDALVGVREAFHDGTVAQYAAEHGDDPVQ